MFPTRVPRETKLKEECCSFFLTHFFKFDIYGGFSRLHVLMPGDPQAIPIPYTLL